mmetsp:Transcript_61485/g.70505  ORF Transcript_61485/g.70505 Transcript_61485/m.70505 type:complete len:335 (-) Transcript_61485:480-1484(-)
MNLTLGVTGVLQDSLDGRDGTSEVVHAQFFESSSGEGGVIIQTVEQRVDFDGGLSGGGQGSLGLLASRSQSSHGSGIVSHVGTTVLLLEIVGAEFDQFVIEIFSSQMGVTSSGFDFEDTVFDGQKGNIESSSSEIEDQNVSFSDTLLIQTVGNSGGGGFVDDSQDVEASDGSSILGGLSLGIVEVSGDSDNSVLNLLTEETFSGFSHFGQDHGGDFLRLESLDFTLELNFDDGLSTGSFNDLEWPVRHIALNGVFVEFTTNKSLGIENGVFGVSGNLILGGVTNKTLGFGESNIRGSGSVSLIVGNDFNLIVLHHSDARVGCSQIDSNSGHCFY